MSLVLPAALWQSLASCGAFTERILTKSPVSMGDFCSRHYMEEIALVGTGTRSLETKALPLSLKSATFAWQLPSATIAIKSITDVFIEDDTAVVINPNLIVFLCLLFCRRGPRFVFVLAELSTPSVWIWFHAKSYSNFSSKGRDNYPGISLVFDRSARQNGARLVGVWDRAFDFFIMVIY